VLSHFSLLPCSIIPLAKGAQSFSMLQYSIIFHCYSTQPFSIATILNHFQCYSTQSLLVITVREAAQSFCKMTELGDKMTELGGGCARPTHGSVAGVWDRAALCAGSRGTEPRGARGHVGRGSNARWLGRSVHWLGTSDGP
jgi:hypothetical protein